MKGIIVIGLNEIVDVIRDVFIKRVDESALLVFEKRDRLSFVIVRLKQSDLDLI
jgi:hypothetical protein